MHIILLFCISFILGTIYYYIMEKNIPLDSNCSFISSKWTDIIAFTVGTIIIYKGYKYNDNLVVLLGGSIIVEHIWQLFPKFTLKRAIQN
jgi:hypothetical protein